MLTTDNRREHRTVEAKQASKAHIPEVVQERSYEEGSLTVGLKFIKIVAGTPHPSVCFRPKADIMRSQRSVVGL
jgi:hypothetical protein